MADNFAAPIPAAVRAAAERADAIQQEHIRLMNGEEPLPEGEEEQPPEANGQLTQEEFDALSPEEQEQYVASQDAAEQQQPSEQEQHFTQGQEPQPPAEEIPESSWQHRYLSMQGRYQAEVPKLRNQVQQLMGQVTNLNRLLATVQAPPPAPAREATFKSQVKPEEIAEYGPDFVDLVGRIVKDTTRGHEEQITNLKNQVTHVGKQIGANARENMLMRLTEQVPDWQAINVHQDFVDWLTLPDAYSGDIRHNMLMAAFERNDTPRVIAFFKGFLTEMAAVAPPEPKPGARQTSLPKTPLRNLAAPGRARSTAPPPRAPAEKPIISASDISKFYTEKGLGKWKGREKEAADIEAQIFLAQNEGRIR